ncbi:MAG: CDGSH iron-sulfur domain-containing protein [Gemmatimonadales bacterium]|nr:CDGSH iron-sulfur domain-containing protein [Gemmatimonadales bacterium]
MAAKVTVLANGPIKVEGEFTLHGGDGTAFGLGGKTAVFLCRCGASENKPFCDGKHKACGFADAGAARDLG